MPWTLAHPAVLLPLRRFCPGRLDFGALVIGALVPDMGYYLNLFALATYAHTALGSLVVGLPAGIAALAAFHFLKGPVCHLLPEPHRRPLEALASRRPTLRPGDIAKALLSIALGAWSHVAWDSITHRSGWIVARIPALRQPVASVGDDLLPLYYILQQISTVVGVIVLAIVYCRWLRRKGVRSLARFDSLDRWRYAFLSVLLAVAAMIAVPFAALSANDFEGLLWYRAFVFKSAVYGTATFVPLLCITAALVHAGRVHAR